MKSGKNSPKQASDRQSKNPVLKGYSGLARSVAFQLRLTQAASFQAYAERVADRALKPGRYAIMQLVADNPGIGQTDLSQAVGRDKTTLTPTLADLERRGLIKRKPHPDDGRARQLSLTAKGRSTLAHLANHGRQHDEAIDKILGDDRETLLRLLRKLVSGLEKNSDSGE